MKLKTATLVLCLAAGAAWAQNPDVIGDVRSTMKAVEQKKAIDSNNALAASQGNSKPSPAASRYSPPPASKPAAVVLKPVAKPVATAPAAKKPEPVKAKTAVPHIVEKTAPAKAPKNSIAQHKHARAVEHIAVEDKKNPGEPKKAVRTVNLTGRRDPFVSPVVARSMTGSGCSTGKRCLAIDQISLKGIVRSDNGMIAVVVNALDKAYFLHENDPVFNGFVVKITGDSIVFKETLQDRLGKPFTREVTKRISTPAV